MTGPRLHQFRQHKPCYYCGTPGPSTAEHAPARTIFEGSSCGSITVPSCDKHNSQKSGSDTAVKTALLRGIDQLRLAGIAKHLPEELLRSIQDMQRKYRQANGQVMMQRMIGDAPPGLDVDMPFVHQSVEIEEWVRMLTAALVWSVTGTYDSGSDWPATRIFSPTYFPARSRDQFDFSDARSQTEQLHYSWRSFDQTGQWHRGWQPYPNPYPQALYEFAVAFEPPGKRGTATVFRHVFFNSYVYYARFMTSETTKERMREYLQAESDRPATCERLDTPSPPSQYRKKHPSAGP